MRQEIKLRRAGDERCVVRDAFDEKSSHSLYFAGVDGVCVEQNAHVHSNSQVQKHIL